MVELKIFNPELEASVGNIVSLEFNNIEHFINGIADYVEDGSVNTNDIIISFLVDNDTEGPHYWLNPFSQNIGCTTEEAFKYVLSRNVTLNNLLDEFQAPVNVRKDVIQKLLSAYFSNKETLQELELEYYDNHEINTEPSESFEQGYNNALEFVFKELGVKIPATDNGCNVDIADSYTIRVYVTVDDGWDLMRFVEKCQTLDEAKNFESALLRAILKDNDVLDGDYSVRVEISSFDSKGKEHYVDSDEYNITLNNGEVSYEF